MLKRTLFVATLLAGLVVGLAAPASAQPFPPPIVKYVNQYPSFGGLVHVDLTVVNWHVYSPALFVASPNLPPCGLNPSASRTWVDIYNARTARRIYGFCALGTPSDLTRLWFATPAAEKPRAVYITLTDRLRHRRVRSNRVIIP